MFSELFVAYLRHCSQPKTLHPHAGWSLIGKDTAPCSRLEGHGLLLKGCQSLLEPYCGSDSYSVMMIMMMAIWTDSPL